MDNAHEERFQQHQAWLASFAAMFEKQHEANQQQAAMNQRLDAFITRQDGINERLTSAIERLDTTQARVEALLSRMIPPSGNGTDA
jgi:ABC-type transporter Mla subunit MlaD